MAETNFLNLRECVHCAHVWKPVEYDEEACPVCEVPKATTQVPEGMIQINLTPEDLTTLSAICSYYKNTNPFPGKDSQRVAASFIERSRGY